MHIFYVWFYFGRDFANLKFGSHLYQKLKKMISICRHDPCFSFLNDKSENIMVFKA